MRSAVILIALVGARGLTRHPRRSMVMVGLGTMIGPAFSSLGHLAMPLAIVRIVMNHDATTRVRRHAVVVAILGEVLYLLVCSLSGADIVATAQLPSRRLTDIVPGLYYALTVPARLLLPSILGAPASSCASPLPAGLTWGAAILFMATATFLALWPRGRWNRGLVLTGAVTIYLGYLATFYARAFLVRSGRWTEAEFIYRFAPRYHVLPLLGLAGVAAPFLAAIRPVRWADARRGLPALAGLAVGLAAWAVQRQECDTWSWILHQPDQPPTLAALDRVGRVAREEGITRRQLSRVVAPAGRGWNMSLLPVRRAWFHPMKLVEAPEFVTHPLTDAEARGLLFARLTRSERLAIGAGICASWSPGRPGPDARVMATARCLELKDVRESSAGVFRSDARPGYLKFEFDHHSQASFLVLPGLKASDELMIFLRDAEGNWRPGQSVRWLPTVVDEAGAVIDLASVIHWWGEPITQISIQLLKPGEITLAGMPRLLR